MWKALKEVIIASDKALICKRFFEIKVKDFQGNNYLKIRKYFREDVQLVSLDLKRSLW